MTVYEMMKEMAEMQKELDKAIMAKSKECDKPMESYDLSRVMMALIDEVGELVHELKGDWCWWKKTQQAVNRDRVLEELVDVWHFGLSINNHRGIDPYEVYVPATYKIDEELVGLTDSCGMYSNLIRVTYALGFTIEDVYYAYIGKNQENYRRIKEGY